MLDLLLRLQASGSKSYLFITHDLEMARNLTDSILVMQDGKITVTCEFCGATYRFDPAEAGPEKPSWQSTDDR